MFADLLAGAVEPLLALAITACAAGVMRLVAWDAARARWQREFGGGWQALQRDRIIARTVPVPPLSGGAALTRRERALQGWRNVQRNRIARRRCARGSNW